MNILDLFLVPKPHLHSSAPSLLSHHPGPSYIITDPAPIVFYVSGFNYFSTFPVPRVAVEITIANKDTEAATRDVL